MSLFRNLINSRRALKLHTALVSSAKYRVTPRANPLKYATRIDARDEYSRFDQPEIRILISGTRVACTLYPRVTSRIDRPSLNGWISPKRETVWRDHQYAYTLYVRRARERIFYISIK